MDQSVVVYTSNGYRYSSDVLQYMKIHTHENIYQIYYCINGKSRYKIEENSVVLSAGEYIIITPDTRHGMTQCIADSDLIDIKFGINDLRLKQHVNRVALSILSATETIQSGFELLRIASESGSFFRRKQISLYLEAILYETLEAQSKEVTSSLLDYGAISSCTKRVIHFLEGAVVSPQFKYSRETIANMLGYNVRYMSNKFVKDTGFSMWQYLTILRVEKAKELLQLTTLSVAEIAKLLDYNSAAAFSKSFKSLTGTPPSEYRDQTPDERTLVFTHRGMRDC